MEWRFKELTPNDTLQNASHLEFFHNEALHSSVDALVREDIQNRLDARRPNATHVEVRYRLCGPVSLDARASWFTGIASHLSAPEVTEEVGYTPSLSPRMRWLVIEDFNTTGLEGDPAVFQDPPSHPGAPRNDFFWFVRNVGRSGKKGADRGRWGLGKIVYPASSKVRSFFAYTVRRSDGVRLLIGRSVLAVHKVGTAHFDSEGYFGVFNDPEHQFFATPEFTLATLNRFKDGFGLSRQDEEPGLSIVVPWPEEDITYTSLIASLIEHWFSVILDGRLRVQVTDTDGKSVTINSENIEAIVRSHQDEAALETKQVIRRIEFARAAQAMDFHSSDFNHLNPCPDGTAPKWDNPEERFPAGSLDTAKAAFKEGRMVGFEVPVKVKRVNASLIEDASFEVYLKKTDAAHPPVEVFLREGLCISGQKFLKEHGLLAIVKVEDDALGTMLGDAENPAHTRWERGGKHFKGRYEYGPSYISFVQRAAQSLAWVLSKQTEGLDRDLLKHLFYVPEEGNQISIVPRRRGPIVTPPLPDIPPREQFIQLSQTATGFKIKRSSRATRHPDKVQVRAAYDVSGGSPFKYHHPADFDFANPGNLELVVVGGRIESAESSKLVVKIEAPDFEIAASGFDPHRDLIVDARPIHAEAEAEEESDDNVEVGI